MRLGELFVLVSVVAIWATFVLTTNGRLLRVAQDLARAGDPSARFLSPTKQFALSANMIGIGPSGRIFLGIVGRKDPEKQQL